MVVLCCYAKLHPATAAALAAFAPGAEFADTSGSIYAYWEQISSRWADPGDLAIIEGDIEIHAGVLPGFTACPQPWCVYPYQVHDRGTLLDFGLGCARFRAEAQRAVSTAAIQSWPGECEQCRGAPGCWAHLDCKITLAMHAAGIVQCVHWPGVQHHNARVLGGQPVSRMRWCRISPDLRDSADQSLAGMS